MKKKTLYITAMLLVVSSLLSMSTMAINENTASLSQEKILVSHEYNEFTDSEVLLERAKNDVHDAPIEIVNNISATVSANSENETILLENALKTTQMIGEYEYSNGKHETEYVTTIISDISMVENNDGSIVPQAAFTKEEDNSGLSTDVRVYCKIYYSTGTHTGENYVKLTKVEGRFQILDTTCKIFSRELCGYWGGGTIFATVVRYDSPWYSGLGNPMSRNFNGDMMTDEDGVRTYVIGGKAKYGVSRGSQSWFLTVDCNIVGTP